MTELYNFLRLLKQNNNREWFNDNKDKYLESKKLFEDFVAQVIFGISKFDSSIASVQVKESIFRIYRDVRFSHDKSPYKTHFGAFMAKGGKTSSRGGYYVHFEPDTSLLSGGIWRPEPVHLKAIHRDIYNNPEEFIEIVENPKLTKFFIHDNEKTKKVPQQYPKDSIVSEWLKNKSYTPVCYVSEDFFEGNDAVERTVERLKLLEPLNHFINFTIT